MRLGISSITFEDVCTNGTKKHSLSPGLNSVRVPKGRVGAVTEVLRSVLSGMAISRDTVVLLAPDGDVPAGTLRMSMDVDGEGLDVQVSFDYRSGSAELIISSDEARIVGHQTGIMGSHGLGDSCFIDASDVFGLSSVFDGGRSYADLIIGSQVLGEISSALDDALADMQSRDGRYPSRNLNRLEMTLNKHRLSERELKAYRENLEESRCGLEGMSLEARADVGDTVRELILRLDPSSCDAVARQRLMDSMIALMDDTMLQSGALSGRMGEFYRCVSGMRGLSAVVPSSVADLADADACICGRPMDEQSVANVRRSTERLAHPYPYSVIGEMAVLGTAVLDRIMDDLESIRASVFEGRVPHGEEIVWIRSLRTLKDNVESAREIDVQMRLIDRDLEAITRPDRNADPSNNMSACREAIRRTKAQQELARESLLMSERRLRLETLVEAVWEDAISRAEGLCASRANEALGDEVVLSDDGKVSIHPGLDRWAALAAKSIYVRELGALRGVSAPFFVLNAGTKVPRDLSGILAEESVTLVLLGEW